MPAVAFKSLVPKIGRALRTTEQYWKDAKSAMKAEDADFYYKAMATVKKHLGLDAGDMLLAGMPARLVVEANFLSEGVRGEVDESDDFEKALQTAILERVYQADKFDEPIELVEKTDGEISIRVDLFEAQLVEGLTSSAYLQWLRRMLPCASDNLLKRLIPV